MTCAWYRVALERCSHYSLLLDRTLGPNQRQLNLTWHPIVPVRVTELAVVTNHSSNSQHCQFSSPIRQITPRRLVSTKPPSSCRIMTPPSPPLTFRILFIHRFDDEPGLVEFSLHGQKQSRLFIIIEGVWYCARRKSYGPRSCIISNCIICGGVRGLSKTLPLNWIIRTPFVNRL